MLCEAGIIFIINYDYRWPEAGVSNVYSGAASSIDTESTGLIVAHWSSTGSLTPLVFSWPPLIVAAGLAWNHNTHWVQ